MERLTKAEIGFKGLFSSLDKVVKDWHPPVLKTDSSTATRSPTIFDRRSMRMRELNVNFVIKGQPATYMSCTRAFCRMMRSSSR